MKQEVSRDLTNNELNLTNSDLESSYFYYVPMRKKAENNFYSVEFSRLLSGWLKPPTTTVQFIRITCKQSIQELINMEATLCVNVIITSWLTVGAFANFPIGTVQYLCNAFFSFLNSFAITNSNFFELYIIYNISYCI